MGLSNYLPNSRLSQAGVCTSTTRPASPYEGQMIYETDTNRVLVYDASAWVMIADTDQPPGMQLVKTQTIGTAVASVTVNDAFPTEFDVFEVISVGTTSTATDNAGIRLTVGGTASTTGYYGVMPYALYSGSLLNHTDNNASSFTAAVGLENPGIGMAVNMRFISPNGARATRFTSTHTRNISGHYVGVHSVTTAYDGFSIIPGAGTLTGGTIRVYGYRNS